MDDIASHKTPPLPPVAGSSIPLVNPHANQRPQLTTVAIGLQSSRHKPEVATQDHHAPLCPETPYVYSDNGSICLEHQAPIPLTYCIVTNELADQTARVPLRDPRSPSTWWGKRPRLKVGLSAAAAKRIKRGTIATWVAMSIGAAFVSLGIIVILAGVSPALALTCFGIGTLWALFAGFFRANSALTAPVVGRSFTVINGAHPEFLKQFDQYENGELIKELPSS